MRRRLVISVLALVLLAGVGALLWIALGGPPPAIVLEHGFPPTGGPTGRTKTNSLGVEFAEIAPGCVRVRWRILIRKGDWLGRLSSKFGLDWGDAPELTRDGVDRYVVLDEPIWISTVGIDAETIPGLDLPGGVTVPDWRDDFTEWMRNADGGRYRDPTDDELGFTAAHGLWPGDRLYRPTYGHRIYPLGRRCQGFEGHSFELAPTLRIQEAMRAGEKPVFRHWRGPPLVWLPAGDAD